MKCTKSKSELYLSSFIYRGNSQVALDVHGILDQTVYPLIESFRTLDLHQIQNICYSATWKSPPANAGGMLCYALLCPV